MEEIKEICQGRLDAIKGLERTFFLKPTLGDAMIIKDLLVNWVDQKWENHLDSPPSEDYILKKIEIYSSYIHRKSTKK